MLVVDTKVEKGNICVVTFSGEFDLFEKDSVFGLLNEVRNNEPSGVILDLSAISFMDSTGVGILMTSISQFQTDGIKTAVVLSDNAHVLRRLGKQLQLVGLTEKFYNSTEEAIAEMLYLKQQNR